MEEKLTRRIRYALRKENLYLSTFRDAYGVKVYHIVDGEGWIKTAEAGISLEEAATYAGVKWVEE